MSQETITFTLKVTPQQAPFTVKDANGNTLADGANVDLGSNPVGQNADDTLFTVSGGTSPYNFAVAPGSSVPSGMSLNSTINQDNSETVTLNGTPDTPGDASFGLAISDSAGASVTAAVRRKVG